MDPEAEFLARMKADPRANQQRVAREAGISNRAARRLVAELEAQGGVRSGRRVRALVVAVALSLAVAAAWAFRPEGPAGSDASPAQPRSPEAVQGERDLYGALDRRDRAKVEEALAQLKSEDEGLRLAALRYVATVGGAEQASALLPLLDDPVDRVRLAAVQFVARVEGTPVDMALARVAVASERPLAERTLALGGLRERRSAEPLALARALLPALEDGSQPLREQVVELLARLTGKRVDAPVAEPTRLHAAWRVALASN